jgi:hypothetical protein
MANYIDNDYTINLNSKTLDQGRNTTATTYSVSSSVTSSTEISSSTLYFATQSLNTYTEDTDEASEAYVFFGRSVVVVNANKILIGAPHKNHTGYINSPADVGSVFEFTFTSGTYDADGSEWVQTAEISASDMADMDPVQHVMEFGHAIAATGSYLVVGAPKRQGASGSYTDNIGAVYVYNSGASGYVQESFIRSPNNTNGDYFGSVIGMNVQPNKFIVGVPTRENAYVYASSSGGWALETTITSSLVTRSDAKFGSSVALSGNYLAVGAPLDHVGATQDAGTVALFKSSSGGWSEIGLFSSSAPSTSAFYGRSLAMLTNKRLVVGEEFGKVEANKTGSIEISSFDDSGNKTLIQAIGNSRANNSGRFGRYVSAYPDGQFIATSRIISNDNGTTDSTTSEGERAVLVYESGSGGTWTLSNTLTRDTSLATYYASTPGKWTYTIDGSGFSLTSLQYWYSQLSIKDGIALHGIDGANDSNFRDLDNTGLFDVGFGEFRTWRTYTSSSSVVVTSSVDVVITSSTPGDFVPFRFHQNGPVNTREQTTSKAYKSFLGDPKS